MWRFFVPEDLDALYKISLATGNRGQDASHLYEDPQLIGHIYSAPYGVLNPGLVLIVEHEGKPAGFAVGTLDTLLWEEQLEELWWPSLRQCYADPTVLRENRTPDQKRAYMIHHPERTPVSVCKTHPAHFHMNLMSSLQGRGIGSLLGKAWLAMAASQGKTAVHIGTNPDNHRAIRFWENQGFKQLFLDEGESSRLIQMGRN